MKFLQLFRLIFNFIFHAIYGDLILVLELVQLHLNFLKLLAGFRKFLFFEAQILPLTLNFLIQSVFFTLEVFVVILQFSFQ
jgi:hypothetical protein